MRRHRLPLAILLVLLFTIPALARSPIRRVEPRPSITAVMRPGLHAGTLVLTFHNPRHTPLVLPIRVRADTAHYDWLTVELTSDTVTRTLALTGARDKSVVEYVTIPAFGTHDEAIDLDSLTADLPRGTYVVDVVWDSPQLFGVARMTTLLPHRCGLTYARVAAEAPAPRPSPPSPAPSKLPYALAGLAIAALLVARALAKRAGTAGACVPHSVP